MAMGEVVRTRRSDRYHVEVQHPGSDWNHIHPPDWEHTTLPELARQYAVCVERDHPGSEARIVRTRVAEVTKLLTGKTTTVDLGAWVVDR